MFFLTNCKKLFSSFEFAMVLVGLSYPDQYPDLQLDLKPDLYPDLIRIYSRIPNMIGSGFYSLQMESIRRLIRGFKGRLKLKSHPLWVNTISQVKIPFIEFFLNYSLKMKITYWNMRWRKQFLTRGFEQYLIRPNVICICRDIPKCAVYV